MASKAKEKTVRMWVARDNYTNAYGRGTLTLHLFKPKLNRYRLWHDDTSYGFKCVLCNVEFPEVTFDNSPQEVEIKLVNNL